MVRSFCRLLGLLCLFWSITSGVLEAQVPPSVTVGVRPDRVRVGESFTVTVRVVGPALPEDINLDPGAAAELLGTSDRTSTGLGQAGVRQYVLERDFELTARAPGSLALSPVLVSVAGEVLESEVPVVQVAEAGLDWGVSGGARPRQRGREDRLLPEGAPPAVEGRTYDATQPQPYPYGVPGVGLGPSLGGGLPPALGPGYQPGVPYGPGVGDYRGGYPGASNPGYNPGAYNPGAYGPGGYGSGAYGGYGGYGLYGGLGRLPPGEGWAETATADPWWPEMIPELGYYQSLEEDPEGLAVLETGLTPERVFVGQQVTLVATATFPPEAQFRMGRDPEFFPPGLPKHG